MRLSCSAGCVCHRQLSGPLPCCHTPPSHHKQTELLSDGEEGDRGREGGGEGGRDRGREREGEMEGEMESGREGEGREG